MIVTRDASRSGAPIDVRQGPIPAGSELACDPSDVAVFCRDGRVLGVLGPGRAALSAVTAPFLSMALASDGSLAASVYFVRATPIRGVRFGGPIGAVGSSSGQPVAAQVFGEASAVVRDPLRVVQAVAAAPDADPSVTFSSYIGYALLEAARAAAAGANVEALASDSQALVGPVSAAARSRLLEVGIELVDVAPFTVVAAEPQAPVPPAEVVYEMLWDCRFCGTKKLLGLKHRHCPSCGAPQNAADRYFPSDADKVRAEDHEYFGADVHCTHCGEANSKNSKHCGGCGAPLEGAMDVARRQDQVVAPGVAFEGQSVADARRERQADKSPPAAKKKSSTVKVVMGIGCLSIIVLVVLATVAAFWKKEGSLVVTGHSWRREVAVERYGPTADSSWCDSVPPGARGTSRTREVRSHRRIPDGQDCRTRKVDRGNGTFVEKQECSTRYRDEPIYDDRCYYTIDRWSLERTANAAGASMSGVAWPDLGSLRTGTCIGCERAGSRKETYTVELTDSDSKKQTCDFDSSKWASFRDGSHWKGGIRVIGGGLDCSTLAPD